MKIPIKLGKDTIEIQEFLDGDERIALIDGRFYRFWAIPNSDQFYCMVQIGNHQRSIKGTRDQILEKIAQIHKIYQDYENRVRNSKEVAQRDRDRRLNDLSEPSKQ